jgi:hypothetical protein
MGIDALVRETLKNNPTKSNKFIRTRNHLIINWFCFVNYFRLTTRFAASL